MFKSKKDFTEYAEKAKNEKISSKDIKLCIGTGTCGNAAGAKEVLEALENSIKKRGLTNCTIKKVGCVGFCHAEPTLEVFHADGDSILLGYLTPDTIDSVVDMHIVKKSIESKHVLQRNFDESIWG